MMYQQVYLIIYVLVAHVHTKKFFFKNEVVYKDAIV